MIFITIIFVLVFLTYSWLIFKTVGQLWSISAGYYALKKKDINPSLFTIFLFNIAIYLFVLTAFTEHWLFMAGAFGAIVTGVATEYMGKVTNVIHYGGSIVMMASVSIGCWVCFNAWWVVAGIVLAAAVILIAHLKFKKIKNPLYWGEMAVFVLIVAGVIYGYI